MTDTITITVDPDLADAYRAASDQDRRKLDLLLNLRLRDVTRTGESLLDVMAEITRNARARGLTPEILDELLRGPKLRPNASESTPSPYPWGESSNEVR